MANETVPIIIPASQKGDSIGACLASVCAQTRKDLEIIIVYLRSPDKTLEVIRSFDDSRIKVIEQVEKTGPGGARDLGLQAATGKYVGFVDSDDFLPPAYFEALVQALEKANADIAMGETVLVDGQRRHDLVKHRRERVVSGFEKKYALLVNGAVFDKLFRMSLIKKNGLSFPSGVFWEDNPFLLQAFWESDRLALTPKAVYDYKKSPRDESRDKRLRQDIPIVAKMMLDFVASKNPPLRARRLVQRKLFELFVGRYMFQPDVIRSLFPLFGGKMEFVLAFSKALLNILARRIRMKLRSTTAIYDGKASG